MGRRSAASIAMLAAAMGGPILRTPEPPKLDLSGFDPGKEIPQERIKHRYSPRKRNDKRDVRRRMQKESRKRNRR